MDIKTAIEVVSGANNAKEAVDNRAEEIFKKWSAHFYNGHGFVNEIKFYNSIELHWQDYWRNELQESGILRVPEEVFCGDWESWLDEKIEESKCAAKRLEEKEAARVEEQERKQLAALKEKYGE